MFFFEIWVFINLLKDVIYSAAGLIKGIGMLSSNPLEQLLRIVLIIYSPFLLFFLL